ncbi:MAG: glycosyltransferase [Methanobrevibacter sp.]|nr:glycosyltransferase [Methanobrevibacter sp.]
MKVIAIVVIYNKKCSESVSLDGLRQYGNDIEVAVFDNSTKDYGNRKYCDKNGYQYYTMNRNIGLSKAYNYVIEQMRSDYYIILDDDTQLNEEYFKKLKLMIANLQYDVILPIVKADNMIISPSIVQFGCRVKRIRDINAVDEKHITAINSGMIVKKDVYNKIVYDEDLFLDYVDHEFMREVRKEHFRIKIMKDVVIFQNFSMLQKKDLKSERVRFDIYKKDFKEYCKKCNNMLYYYINIWQYSRNLKKKYGGGR